jgi:hypothetical protein
MGPKSNKEYHCIKVAKSSVKKRKLTKEDDDNLAENDDIDFDRIEDDNSKSIFSSIDRDVNNSSPKRSNKSIELFMSTAAS